MDDIAGKKCLTLSLLSFLGCVLIYLFLFYQQFGPYIPAEYWLREVAVVKQHLCQQAESPKAVILSGSNALFGFDSHQLEHFLERPVINFGLHGGLPLGYLLNRYDLCLRRGDMVILPLEYEFYETAEINTSWFTTQVIAWDREYFDQLSAVEKIRFIVSVPPLRLLANLSNKFLVRERRELPPPEVIIDSVEEVWRYATFRKDYSYKNLNDRGDIERREPIHFVPSPDYPVFREGFEISEYAKTQLSRFFSRCGREGASVVITWPCIIEGGNTDDRRASLFAENTKKIKELMASLGVAVVGEPMDFGFPESYFYDSTYHLDEVGRQLRTLKVADLMIRNSLVSERSRAAAKRAEIEKTALAIQQRVDTLKTIRHLYWDLGRASEAVQMVEDGAGQGYLNEETAPILLDNLRKNQNPSLHAHVTEILASPMAKLDGYAMGNGAYLMGTTPDGWTTDGMPGYLLLKPAPRRNHTRKIYLTCNAAPPALPLTVTLQGESGNVSHTFDHPGEIEIPLREAADAGRHLYIVSTDKYWVPGGPDNRKLGVRIRIE